jgi:hypothetical protein
MEDAALCAQMPARGHPRRCCGGSSGAAEPGAGEGDAAQPEGHTRFESWGPHSEGVLRVDSSSDGDPTARADCFEGCHPGKLSHR